jgi:hypothetical protein
MIPEIEPAIFRVLASTNCATACLITHSQCIYTELKLVPCIMAFASIFVDTEHIRIYTGMLISP